MKYEEMPAGPALNRAIAEQVMKWDLLKEDPGGVYVYTCGRIVRPTRWDCRDFDPSGDIGHAWEVAEKLRLILFPANSGGWVACRSGYMDECDNGAPMHGDGWIDAHIECQAEAPSAVLAICRAAMRITESSSGR